MRLCHHAADHLDGERGAAEAGHHQHGPGRIGAVHLAARRNQRGACGEVRVRPRFSPGLGFIYNDKLTSYASDPSAYGARLPYQLMLAPRTPRARFEDDGPTGGALLHDGLRRLAGLLGSSPPLNLWVRTAPRGASPTNRSTTASIRLSICPRT